MAYELKGMSGTLGFTIGGLISAASKVDGPFTITSPA